MNNHMQRNVTAIALAIATVFGTAQAQQSDLFDTHVLPESLVFEPTQHQSMSIDVDLVVSGPEGFYLRKSYPSGSLSEFNPSDFPDLHFPDGTYTYEVRVMRMGSEYRTRDDDSVALTARADITPVHGAFSILGGALVTPKTEPSDDKFVQQLTSRSTTAPARDTQTPLDVVIADDQIVQGSLCVGFDCVNGESFGFDTIRMKENNTRIKFQDTSTSSSFPDHDWQLTANDSANGGLNKFSIENTTVGRIPFTIVGNAPTNSLWVANNGNIGFGTSNPVLQTHTADGNTPGMRLEQDGSSGFTPQIWDIAGNEANFFVRDVTNGSRLPFRIRPGAPSSSIDIAGSGNVGIGFTSPDTKLHVRSTSGNAAAKIEEASGTLSDRQMLTLTNNGGARIDFINTNSGADWRFATEHLNDNIIMTKIGSGGVEFRLSNTGDLEISGSLTQGSSRAIKTAIQSVDGLSLIDKLLQLDFAEWSYTKTPGSRHFGPMAEDFFELFEFGQSDKHIAPGDMAGIAMAASKELALQNSALKERVAELEVKLERLNNLDAELKRIENRLNQVQSINQLQ